MTLIGPSSHRTVVRESPSSILNQAGSLDSGTIAPASGVTPNQLSQAAPRGANELSELLIAPLILMAPLPNTHCATACSEPPGCPGMCTRTNSPCSGSLVCEFGKLEMAVQTSPLA